MAMIVDYRQALLELLNVRPIPRTLADLRNPEVLEALPDSPEKQEAASRAQDFIAKYGRLRSPFGCSDVATVTLWSDAFARSLTAWSNTREQNDQLNKRFLAIFNDPVGPPGEERSTAVRPDILAGTVEIEPRDLLDAMAKEVIESRKTIARCAICSRFFYRHYSHDKYCSPACGDEARRKGQSDWIRTKRKQKEAKQLPTKKGRKTH